MFCAVFYTLNGILKFSFLENAITPFEIALFHTLFNLATTAVLLPFAKQLEKLACRVVKEKKKAVIGLSGSASTAVPEPAIEKHADDG